ncbi:hypothetical protein QC763_113355 [Podospora pseudopauciseta]|uniref:Uncharacterized protein n=2 Tax=Podospora TaxID=5144 RepID=A0ABR0HZT5_9PEZI|nr:hypothetical protein QC763_113355 [Podospora pseudopauciseta]KAK4682139.1 hypothetical protein QC764_113355 [Podospora pseudoanserina]
MGNLCGKPSSDAFSSPGRRLDSAPPPGKPSSASVPQSVSAAKTSKAPPKVGGPSRTLGGGGDPSSSQDDARRKAAEAAEARLQQSKKGGKLQAQLDKDKAKTRVDTLKDASEIERRHRDADSNAEILRNS